MSQDKFWEHVGNSTYYRKVLRNLVKFGGSEGVVRFGILGTGVAPNYQVLSTDGVITTFNGLGHNRAPSLAEQFDDDHLSSPYKKADVQRFIGNARQE